MNIKEAKEELEQLDSILEDINARIPAVRRSIEELNKKLEETEAVKKDEISVGDTLYAVAMRTQFPTQKKYIVKVTEVRTVGVIGRWCPIENNVVGPLSEEDHYFGPAWYDYKKLF